MLKVKIPKIGLMILTSVFCLFLSGVAAEKECWDSLGGGPTFTGNHTYTPDWYPEFQYDPDNPDEIDRNSSVEIKVIGGFPPYSWSVSGNGVILSLNETEVPSNALYADNTACGTATITVIDKCGDSCTGYVRCTTGSWVMKCSNASNYYGCSPWESVWGGESYDIIQGYQKWEMIGKFARTSKCCPGDAIDCSWDYPDCPSPPCGDPCSCDGVIGRCGEGTVTLWPAYHYYEWGC